MIMHTYSQLYKMKNKYLYDFLIDIGTRFIYEIIEQSNKKKKLKNLYQMGETRLYKLST